MTISAINHNIAIKTDITPAIINKNEKKENPVFKDNSSLDIKDKKSINNKDLPQAKTSINIVDENPSPLKAYQKVLYPTNNIKDKNSNNDDVYYINGMITKPKAAEKGATAVANLVNKPVTLLYNPTEGPIRDLIEAALQVAHIPMELKTVNSTVERFSETLKNGKELKVIGHSQGAAIAASALTKIEKELISQGKSKSEVDKIMSKVTVVTIGGASSKEDFPSAIKLVERKSAGDLVPKVAGKTGVERPEDLLYTINETKDDVKKQGLLKRYTQKLNDRVFGKIGTALTGAVAGAVSLITEYNSIKSGVSAAPSKNAKEIAKSDLKISDIVNKYHSTTEYDTGYLNNPQDCKAIHDAFCA